MNNRRRKSDVSYETATLNAYNDYNNWALHVLDELTMTGKDKQDLKRRIMEEMTVNYSGALEKNFDLAKQFIRITRDGRVDILVKNTVSGQDRILLYLIGKLYAKEAGLAPTDSVSNKELMNDLGIPEGSLLPWLRALRKKPGIKQMKEEKR